MVTSTFEVKTECTSVVTGTSFVTWIVLTVVVVMVFSSSTTVCVVNTLGTSVVMVVGLCSTIKVVEGFKVVLGTSVVKGTCTSTTLVT